MNNYTIEDEILFLMTIYMYSHHIIYITQLYKYNKKYKNSRLLINNIELD